MTRSKIFTDKKNTRDKLYANVPMLDLVKTASIFGQAYTIYLKGFELTLAEKQLSFSQWLTLSILYTSPKPVNAVQLKRLLSIEAPTVSQLLSRLEKRRLLLRRHSRKDKRSIDVYLTEQGYQLYQETLPLVARRIEEAFGPMSTSQREQFSRLSRQVRNNCLKSFGMDTANADLLLKLLVTFMSRKNELDDGFWEKV